MAKPEWGIKRICVNCGSKYYDMQKSAPACPSCGAEHNPELVLRSRRNRLAEEEPVERDAPLAASKSVDPDLEMEDAAEDESIIAEDDDVLEEGLDDDDVNDGGFMEDPSELDDDDTVGR